MSTPKHEAHETVNLQSFLPITAASKIDSISSHMNTQKESKEDAGASLKSSHATNHRATAPNRSPPPPEPFKDRSLYPLFVGQISEDFDLESVRSVSLDDIAPDPITVIKSNISTQSTRYGTPLWQKSAVRSLAGWCTVCASVSSTSLLGASEEIANDLSTTKLVVTLSTAGLLFAMALSGFIWSPLQSVCSC